MDAAIIYNLHEQNEVSELKKKKKGRSLFKSISVWPSHLASMLSPLQESHTGTTLNWFLKIVQQTLDHKQTNKKGEINVNYLVNAGS